MKLLPFRFSSSLTIGIELELQLIDTHSYAHISRAKDLIRSMKEGPHQQRIKPEITQSMIEINTSIHQSPKSALDELLVIQAYLLSQAEKLDICFSGGGTHPFQKWIMQKIFPSKRFKNLSKQYRYLSKRSSVFGQHIHIGCHSADDALYLTHALSRYIPHFIAMSASSPFYQGVDTGFHSSRSNIFNAFPLSGVIPYLMTWHDFSNYFHMMKNAGVIETMKDFYWDIRPKPEYGSVEIRVFDTPLTIYKAVLIAAYVQSLAHHLLNSKRNVITPVLYYLYNYNRFLACRYGLEGDFINPYTLQHNLIVEDILETLSSIKNSIEYLNNSDLIARLLEDIVNKKNDAVLLRQINKQVNSLPKLVMKQSELWSKQEFK